MKKRSTTIHEIVKKESWEIDGNMHAINAKSM